MNQIKLNQISIFGLIIASICMSLTLIQMEAQSPSVTQSYGLTLERDDFPAAAPVAGSPTTFQTAVSTRSSFALVFRNGLLQRPCGVPTGPCDYTPSGNVTATFPANIIQAGDLVTVFFYR